MGEEVEEVEEKQVDWRGRFAYIFMTLFVVSSSLGAMLFNVPLGFVVLGLTSGIYGKLLGDE